MTKEIICGKFRQYQCDKCDLVYDIPEEAETCNHDIEVLSNENDNKKPMEDG